MADQEVVVYVHRGNRERQGSQSVVVALGCVDAKSRRALFEHGFVAEGDSAVMEVAGYNAERLCRVLQALERWAEKQGAELVFRWRLSPGKLGHLPYSIDMASSPERRSRIP